LPLKTPCDFSFHPDVLTTPPFPFWWRPFLDRGDPPPPFFSRVFFFPFHAAFSPTTALGENPPLPRCFQQMQSQFTHVSPSPSPHGAAISGPMLLFSRWSMTKTVTKRRTPSRRALFFLSERTQFPLRPIEDPAFPDPFSADCCLRESPPPRTFVIWAQRPPVLTILFAPSHLFDEPGFAHGSFTLFPNTELHTNFFLRPDHPFALGPANKVALQTPHCPSMLLVRLVARMYRTPFLCKKNCFNTFRFVVACFFFPFIPALF